MPAVGKTTLRFGHVVSRRLLFTANTTCVQCGGAMVIRYGEFAAIFRAGTEAHRTDGPWSWNLKCAESLPTCGFERFFPTGVPVV